MVITGGGPGIMQAGNEGAGPENSFAVNIRLPFEQDTNPVMEKSNNVIFYKYFFNRKVAFLKEAHAVALFPGGFGTLRITSYNVCYTKLLRDKPMDTLLVVEKRLKSAERKFTKVEEESGFAPEELLESLKEVSQGEWKAKQAKTELVEANLRLVVSIAKNRITSYNVCYTKLLRHRPSNKFVKGVIE